MEHLKSVMEHLPAGYSYNIGGRDLVEEMNELGKLRTAIMMEKCSARNQPLMCPKPRKHHNACRSNGESNELRGVADLSNILIGKASPPYYSGSPPIRSGNPLIHDAHFCEQRTSRAARNAQGILSMA